ncbi:hypothetical protein [Mucilaginibacter sp. UYCu711]|uniref:hypothetical protein n=1 Tax=Mucilaginibacter sp. UYCu711 TaxID=3156339 RepID=UPI003D203357
MNKLKVRPVYKIGDTHFIVDIDKQVLREFQRPENEISFINHMADLQTHYELRYDPRINSVAQENMPDSQVRLIRVPQLTTLAPEQMALKYDCTVEELKGKPDFEVMVDQQLLAMRRHGLLPKIDIHGEHFIVDLRMEELRHAVNFFPILSLKRFELDKDGDHFEAFYHPITKQIVEIDPKILELPDQVVKIIIPAEIGLDPVSAARIYGIDERELLRRYPIQKDLKAEIIPLSETGIPALIQRNKQALTEDHQQNVQQIKPRNRPKF